MRRLLLIPLCVMEPLLFAGPGGLRDNCRAFDPVKWIELNENDDPTVNMGIKLVCGMAKEVTYVSTLDLNIITLRI